MKNLLMSIADKILLRKRALIETVNEELKNIAQIEHSRHRSFNNFIASSLSTIVKISSCLVNAPAIFSYSREVSSFAPDSTCLYFCCLPALKL